VRLDRPTVRDHDVMRDGEAEAKPTVGSAGGPVRLPEAVEHASEVLGFDAAPVVAHRELHGSIETLKRELNVPPRLRELERVR
jgi:hypothetical protein